MSRMINPICDRCGGVTRQWMQINRRHAGMSFHRSCCCGIIADCFDLPDKVYVTFGGVVPCEDCIHWRISISFNNVQGVEGVNGTWELNRDPGSPCLFRKALSMTVDVDRHANGSCSNFDRVDSYSNFNASTVYSISQQGWQGVVASDNSTTTRPQIFQAGTGSGQSGPVFSNQLVPCDSGINAFSAGQGGSATVSLEEGI